VAEVVVAAAPSTRKATAVLVVLVRRAFAKQ
jgi:hypothetical protein